MLSHDWQLEQRQYIEELNHSSLCQHLAHYTTSISPNVHTKVRYCPHDDSLLVVIEKRIPSHRIYHDQWYGFLPFNSNFQQWLNNTHEIQQMMPTRLYQYGKHTANFNGTIKDQHLLFYPADQSECGLTSEQINNITYTRIWLSKKHTKQSLLINVETALDYINTQYNVSTMKADSAENQHELFIKDDNKEEKVSNIISANNKDDKTTNKSSKKKKDKKKSKKKNDHVDNQQQQVEKDIS